ncbi:carbamoyltransferase HypF [Methylomonas methanica]|uniref:Carbamoyltransferase HypF n=1 Tax=Methylomonas methanica (strain DSM 25384 / MC09) TaxID=857087 RepID=G0A2J3_METMM|nr:carbamoyltransferase HypF [Methylomonas methanica]AEG00173.1 (NiFe) hydrogenase maturation protein HypF [Methylomonas methanica MC09]
MPGRAIRVRGVVQGVGFRPTIWRLARQYGLRGEVWNDGQGVMIHAIGDADDLDAFIRQIPLQLPPLAKLDSLDVTALAPTPDYPDFRIVGSQLNGMHTPIAADAATCPDCLAEIADPKNRRYRYPFTNCTHCGPRLSIVKQIPYDRGNTSMAAFPMCPACQSEYEDPSDRRFHAQANCCPLCGPAVWLEDNQDRLADNFDPIDRTAELIRQGYIVAIKGLGGFHLACNAADDGAVYRLRQRKRRYAKPFALMAKDLGSIRRYALVNAQEEQALQDKTAPIVLLRAGGETLATGIAPGDEKLGFMLPYTPLHSVLLAALDTPIVLTSGNISDEPQCIDNADAKLQLAGIADYWLLHNRDIVNRLDDSVVRFMDDEMRLLRRARGYSPEALTLPTGFETADEILAMGAELKNSFCLVKHGQAVASQHIGDLESATVQHDYRQLIALYQQLYDFRPRHIVIDRHPGYLSSQYGQTLADAGRCELVETHHHHAHLAACLAEHGVALHSKPVLAAIFDGLGMGEAGELWGGEFLLGDYKSCTRLGHMQAIALPGGNQAMREPWRNTYAQLRHYFDWPALQQDFPDLHIVQFLADKPLATLETMIAKNLNSPPCSSAGRWFDAFAAALGIHTARIDYEGQAAIALETLAASRFNGNTPYPDAWEAGVENGMTVLSWRGLWLAVLNDLKHDIDTAEIAARIHHSLIEACVSLLLKLSAETDTDCIVLSGGVFQNRLLLEAIGHALRATGKTVLSPISYPMNDGGLALGQAVIAAAKSLE